MNKRVRILFSLGAGTLVTNEMISKDYEKGSDGDEIRIV